MMAKRDSSTAKNHSNLRLPPLFLRPSVVRGMIDDLALIAGSYRAAVVQVPLLDVQLVDRPRASEDPRLAKANDDEIAYNRRKLERALDRIKSGNSPAAMFPWPNESNPSETTEPAAAQVGRAAPKSQSGLRRSERANDSEEGTRARPTSTKAAAKAERNRQIADAYAAGDAIGDIAAQAGLSKARTLAIAVAAGVPPRPVGTNRLIPNLDRAAVAEAYASGLPARTVADQFGISMETVKACVRGHGGTLRPVGQRSPAYQAKVKRLIEPAEPQASPMSDNACAPIDQPDSTPDAAAPVFPDVARQARARVIARAERAAGHAAAQNRAIERRSSNAAQDAAAVDEFAAALAKVQARRADQVELIVPKRAPAQNEGARLAEAFAQRAAAKAAAAPVKATPLEPAPSREECPRCGIPGWKGCAHFLPCVDQPRKVDLPDPADRAEAQQFVPASVRGKQRLTGTRQGIGASRL